MSNKDYWYKENPDDQIWWKDTPGVEGLWIFSFDRETEFNMYQDYPYKLTEEQIRIFDEENPYWAKYFSPRKEEKH